MKLKRFFKFGVLPIVSGISLMYLTSTVMISEVGFPIILIRAGAIVSLLIMWCYGLNFLNKMKVDEK